MANSPQSTINPFRNNTPSGNNPLNHAGVNSDIEAQQPQYQHYQAQSHGRIPNEAAIPPNARNSAQYPPQNSFPPPPPQRQNLHPGHQRQSGYNPTVVSPLNSNPTQSEGKEKLIAIIAGAVLLLGIVGAVWYFKFYSATDSENIADSSDREEEYTEETTPSFAQTEAQTADTSPGIGASTEQLSLFNRPLAYAGTVTPGGAASLNIIYFQNGRIEGTVNYSNGKSQLAYGSYTWTDNGHKMNVNLTVSSNSDKTYSESWMGSSSYIKDDLAHTLSFSRINTSTGQSMTASFALKP